MITLQHHNRRSHVTRECLPRCRRSHWCCLHANAWACPCCRWSSERWASASERTFVRQLSSRLKISWKRLPLNMRNSLQALQTLSPKKKNNNIVGSRQWDTVASGLFWDKLEWGISSPCLRSRRKSVSGQWSTTSCEEHRYRWTNEKSRDFARKLLKIKN